MTNDPQLVDEDTDLVIASSGREEDYSGGTISWSDEANIQAQDSTDATCVTTNSQVSEWLVAGFDFKVLPDDAIIRGIDTQVRMHRSAGTMQFRRAQLWDGTAFIGTAKVLTENMSTGYQLHPLGGVADLWGTSDLLAETIRNGTFGWGLVCSNTDFISSTAGVDAMWMRITFGRPNDARYRGRMLRRNTQFGFFGSTRKV